MVVRTVSSFHMSDSRDVRTFATELGSSTGRGQPGAPVGAHISEPDPHGAGPDGDEYLTTSLYFDTEHFHVFQRRGSFGRSKYRIRRYGEADAAFLERKLREPTILAKRRTLVPLSGLEQLERAPAAVWSGGCVPGPRHRPAASSGLSGVVPPHRAAPHDRQRAGAADAGRHAAGPADVGGAVPGGPRGAGARRPRRDRGAQVSPSHPGGVQALWSKSSRSRRRRRRSIA